jgi:hypothetical protein
MAQKNRNNLESTVDQNIFDNNNNEILARMVRDVLRDYRDSHFNLLEDELANLQFNSTQTLQQYIDDRLGAVPLHGTVSGIEVGSANQSLSSSGIVSNATYLTGDGSQSIYSLEFNTSIAQKKIVTQWIYNSSGSGNIDNTVSPAFIRLVSSTRIDLIVREYIPVAQNLTLQITAL